MQFIEFVNRTSRRIVVNIDGIIYSVPRFQTVWADRKDAAKFKAVGFEVLS
jgi:hypothetical protein